MQRLELALGFVLHSRPYQETSLLLEIFTRDHGRFGIVAKGARRPSTRARGLLQPFVPLLLSCAGRGELLAMRSFESAGPPHCLLASRLISGIYMNELIMRLTHRFDPLPELFSFYQNTLAHLETECHEQTALRLFEKNLLKAIGYELPLHQVAETREEIQPEVFYTFHPERGPTPIIPSEHSKKFLVVQGKSLLALHTGELTNPDQLLDAKRIMRSAIRWRLGDKPLQTRRLFMVYS